MCSHPPPSHCPAVSQPDSLRGGRVSRHIYRRGSHLFGGQPITRAFRAPLPWVECSPQSTAGTRELWRNPTETHVFDGLRNFGGGSGQAADGGCVTEFTRFTPALQPPSSRLQEGILSLFKDRTNRRSDTRGISVSQVRASHCLRRPRCLPRRYRSPDHRFGQRRSRRPRQGPRPRSRCPCCTSGTFPPRIRCPRSG